MPTTVKTLAGRVNMTSIKGFNCKDATIAGGTLTRNLSR